MCGIFGYKGEEFSFEELEKHFMKIKYRGPDNTTININENDLFLGFHRLAINDLTNCGNQPFFHNKNQLICNGEIYNSSELKREVKYDFISTSDCEVLVPLIESQGLLTACRKLDAEFALLWYDEKTDRLMAARDVIGIRPLFWGQTQSGEKIFSSEMKSITELCVAVEQFPPGYIWNGVRLIRFRSIKSKSSKPIMEKEITQGISYNLTEGVKKRLTADVPVGFLLSGGLDSSLICAIAAKYKTGPIKTFSIGSNVDAIDNKYAENVAEYIGSDHTTVLFTEKEAIESLDSLIYMLETWDITTIRASVGMNILCRWIRENTNIRVIMTGEVSDELFGYKYTDYAPSAKDFQKEAEKRVEELHLYDVLRADRCISGNSLESRVPFGDMNFVDFVMSTPPALKLNTYGKGKFLLRKAFDTGILPEEILNREKAAFSDAVGHSIVDGIKKYANKMIADKDLEEAGKKYIHGTPKTKEALLYRKIFDKHYPNRAETIKDFWMPNKDWENCNVSDPSARVLPNYGDSGE